MYNTSNNQGVMDRRNPRSLRGRQVGVGRGRAGPRPQDEDPVRNAQERDQFISSFRLDIQSNSAPVLVSNDIRKLGDNCYSARLIREYFQNSNSHGYNIRIVQIWKVHNVEHYKQFMQQNYDQVDNMLLWHGTSRRNLVSILQNNLQMPMAATHGHMFGPGVYFADRMSKSAGYTDQSGPEVFLLCQVALGKKWRVFRAESFQRAPQNFNSIKAVGKSIPDRNGKKMLGKTCTVPCGRTIKHTDPSVLSNSVLLHNEYIVFDQDRIRIKFIVHCDRSGSASAFTHQPTASLQLNANASYQSQNNNCIIL